MVSVISADVVVKVWSMASDAMRWERVFCEEEDSNLVDLLPTRKLDTLVEAENNERIVAFLFQIMFSS